MIFASYFGVLGWDGMGWNGMRWNDMEWHRMGWHRMGWDRMGWDGIGWDGMGWDGMGIRIKVTTFLLSKTNKKFHKRISPCNWTCVFFCFSIPKIYFGSRTHKQIAQLVRELKKTSYGNLRWVWWGSRYLLLQGENWSISRIFVVEWPCWEVRSR